jgi:Predicted membrane protein
MNRYIRKIVEIINIREHVDYHTADSSIRKNIAFKGPNVIILACAIVIASVGLNVNSIPVIIGAMLISPVMGPILGLGLGLGTEDGDLLKDSLKNFAVMVIISILASSLFFLLSPLTLENPSELLARTQPTIYDVLIALFGGFAGILETSRKEKGTVISGVAIATALMPPLCTVGYGISRLNPTFMFGALYLFLINTIFIALATFFAVKLFKFPAVSADTVGGKRKGLSKSLYAIILTIIILPSIWTAFHVVKENNFKIHAAELVKKNKNMGRSFVYDHKTNYSRKLSTLELFVAGEMLTDEAKEMLYNDAENFGIMRNQIVIHEDATIVRENIDETEILKGIYEHTDRQIKMLNDSIMKLNARLDAFNKNQLPVSSVAHELFAQYPHITDVSITRGSAVYSENDSLADRVIVFVTCDEKLHANLRHQIERWLKVRLNNENVLVVEAK